MPVSTTVIVRLGTVFASEKLEEEEEPRPPLPGELPSGDEAGRASRSLAYPGQSSRALRRPSRCSCIGVLFLPSSGCPFLGATPIERSKPYFLVNGVITRVPCRNNVLKLMFCCKFRFATKLIPKRNFKIS